MTSMKLFVQIPCLNEEKTLELVIKGIPEKIDGISEIYTLVVDDGSTDRTVQVAINLGVDYIVRLGRNRGLAKAFSTGLEACLHLGADIILNLDGDNQYKGSDIPRLVKPILDGEADIVVGCRDLDGHEEFSFLKKKLQRLGSLLVRMLSRTEVSDATSGFRAVSRLAAVNLSIMNCFSHTVETLIQAGSTDLKVATVDIGVNSKLRESRLSSSISRFLARQSIAMITAYIFHRPMAFFGWLAAFSFSVAVLSGIRIAYYLYLIESGVGKFKVGSGSLLVASLILTALFLIAGGLGTVINGVRFLTLDIRARLRNLELEQGISPLDCRLIDVSRLARENRRQLRISEHHRAPVTELGSDSNPSC